MADELQFLLSSKTHQYLGTIIPRRATVELGWNRTSLAEFTLDDDDRFLPALATPGARIRVLLNGVQEMSGLVESLDGTFPSGEVTVTALSEFQMLPYVLAWPKPTAAIGAQTDEYRIYTGVSETVAKLAIAEASTRLGLGWTVAATGGKGTTTRVETRFHPLLDRILEPLTLDKLQLKVERDAAGAVTVDVTQGTTFATPLTLNTGILENGTWRRQAPTVTRVVVGGTGEGVARELGQFVDTTRETDWAIKREVFRDARSSETGADLSTDAAKAFGEGAVKSSISVVLNEASWFQYRDGYVLGDLVTVQVGTVTMTDVISTVLIEDDPKSGLKVTPSIGDVRDSADKQLAADIAGLARGTRDQGRR